jgi:MFS transporter, putative metabolite:H+ symporter
MSTDGDLISCLDAARVRPRYWGAFVLIVLLLVCELFDFFVVGYLVSAIAPLWRLNFGQTTVMLLGAGIGALLGAIVFGWLADRIGRKPVVVVSSFLCCLCAGSIAFVSDGSWMLFAALRFLVGFGYGGAGASQFALITEYTPLARRTLLTSSMGIPAGVGLLLASLVVTMLFPVLGWRGTAALGFVPLILVVIILFVVPESPKWLISAGRVSEARRVATTLLQFPPGATDPIDAPSSRGGSVLEVYSQPRRFWLIVLIQLSLGTALSGVLLWGPTILAQLLQITPQRAAGLFVFVSLSAIAGRTAFTFLPQWIGRVPSGQLVGYMGAVMLGLAAMFRDHYVEGVSVFFVFLLFGQFFYDGGYSNLNTYAAELFPVRLGARAMGLSAASAGIGKIMGPLALGIIAGTHNLVTPKATQTAVQPAFLFLAACCLLVGLSYSFLGVETHRKSLRLS